MTPSDKAIKFLAENNPVHWVISGVGVRGEVDRRDIKKLDNQKWWYESEFKLAMAHPPKENNLTVLMLRALSKWAGGFVRLHIPPENGNPFIGVYKKNASMTPAAGGKGESIFGAVLAAVEAAAELEP